MHDFQIVFSHPWLLLLLIPALALTLIPYFMLSKKYRTDEKPHYFNGVAYVRNGSCHFRAFGD